MISFKTKMLLILISLMILLPINILAKDTVPVFIVDTDKIFSQDYMEPNPFVKIGPTKFEEIVHGAIKNCEAVVIFAEETFSVEDISLKHKKQGSPFVYLRQSIQDGSTIYLPSVVEPYKLLTQIFEPQPFNTFRLRSRTKLEVLDTFKFIYIYFEDYLNETRIEALKRHDSIIMEVIHAVRQIKNGPIIAFYTGKVNPVKMQVLRFVPIKPIPIPKDSGVMVVSPGGLFRFTGVYAATPTRRAIFDQLPMITGEIVTRDSMITKMAYIDFMLEFNFSFDYKKWTLDDVILIQGKREVGRTNMGISAPWNMSYVCGEPLVIVNLKDLTVVTISQYQIQPRMQSFPKVFSKKKTLLEDDEGIRRQSGKIAREDSQTDAAASAPADPAGSAPEGTPPPAAASGSDLKGAGSASDLPPTKDPNEINFGKAIHCGRYFNIAILSTLMITFTCVLILIYGIVSMMNIKTNDRYEDPLGKQLNNPDN